MTRGRHAVGIQPAAAMRTTEGPAILTTSALRRLLLRNCRAHASRSGDASLSEPCIDRFPQRVIGP